MRLRIKRLGDGGELLEFWHKWRHADIGNSFWINLPFGGFAIATVCPANARASNNTIPPTSVRSITDTCAGLHLLPKPETQGSRRNREAEVAAHRHSWRSSLVLCHHLSPPRAAVGRIDVPLARLQGLGLSPRIRSHHLHLHRLAVLPRRTGHHSAQAAQAANRPSVRAVFRVSVHGPVHVSFPHEQFYHSLSFHIKETD